MKSVPQAIGEILASVQPLATERMLLLEAQGRVLAETVRARHRVPPLDNSAMDGFAVRAADTEGASGDSPKRLRVTQEILAGRLPAEGINPGQAARITTGAPLPKGADAVVMQENTRAAKEGEVEILHPVTPKENVRFAGEDVQAGEEVLQPGRVLGPSQIGLLALLGRSVVQVQRRPRVAILSSGDELVGLDGDTEGWKTIDSNAYAAAAQVREAGGEPLLLPIAPDNRDTLRQTLETAKAADVLLSTAGVSVGPHDFVRLALEDLGFRLSFWRVQQRPGSPLAFGLWEGKPVFGLPGNPVSAAVCFEVYARPALRKMGGHSRVFRPVVKATLEGSVKTRPSHTYFLRVRLEREKAGLIARPSGLQSSAAVKPLAQGNALLVVPEGSEPPVSGAGVSCIVLEPEGLELRGDEIAQALGFPGE